MHIPPHLQKGLQIIKSLEHERVDSPDRLIDIVCVLAEKNRRRFLGKHSGRKAPEEDFRPRQALQYLLRVKFSLSYPEIGRLTFRDHGTVVSAVQDAREMYRIYGKEVIPLDVSTYLPDASANSASCSSSPQLPAPVRPICR